MWLLPLLIVGIAVLLSIPLGRYLARVLDRPAMNPVDRLFDTGPMTWKGYAFAMLAFHFAAFLVGYAILAAQPYHGSFLNPDNKGMLAPSTIFNTACSFLTNTNLQHYSGEVQLSYGSQLLFVVWKQILTPSVGLALLLAIVRGLRGDESVGNFYLDVWRGVAYVMIPLSLIVAALAVLGGVPMTMQGNLTATTMEGADQTIARGPVAALVAIKQLGTNGGGFFGTNSAHPFENPSIWTNILECSSIVLIPMACVVMFGRMLDQRRHAWVLYGVCSIVLVGLICIGVVTDSQPNRAFDGMPVDQSAWGNLEGKELRFGPGAGATWSAVTTCTSNGSVNCMHDSLNPLAGVVPMIGMWLNCIFGGIGVGLINLFVYLIVGVFLAGLMVGRTPEYLGRKVEASEMKLAMLALLVHPLLILGPVGLFAAKGWADGASNNPGPHGFSETLYEFTSAAANNGSGFEGLGDTHGFVEEKANAAPPAKYAFHWDVATGLVMMFGRFVPIIAPLALAVRLGAKKKTPFTAGTLRTDTLTFGFLLLGTILLVGALLFLPAAALGPVAEHVGSFPFGS